MKIASFTDRSPKREEIRTFFGLKKKGRALPGESCDEENVTTSSYPFLAPRAKPVLLSNSFGNCRILEAKDQAFWISDISETELCRLYYAGQSTPLVMSAGEKQCVTMGTKIIVFPDKVYYDTSDGTYGSLDAEYEAAEGVTVSYVLSRLDGGAYEYDASATAPESPADGTLWCDTSGDVASLYKYAASSETWVAVDSTYIKIGAPGVGAAFRVGDGVSVTSGAIPSLNGSYIIEEKGDDFIIVAGIITSAVMSESTLKVERRAPAVDFAIEYSNRIFACRSGLDNDGKLVNEIYASALGDPFNWNSFSGLIADSYAAGVGSEGPFTGAAAFLGYVMFFKERCVHKVFGNRPSNYQVITSNIRGVAKGAGRSLTIVDNVMYYVGTDGVMAYDGSSAELVSDAIGEITPSGAVASARGKYLYVSATVGNTRELYVLDTSLAVWHRYSPMNITAMAGCSAGLLVSAGGALYALDTKDGGTAASALTGFSGTQLDDNWYFVSGELSDERDDVYVERVELTAAVPQEGELSAVLIGDEGENYPVATVRPTVRRTFTVPLMTGRHRRYRLKVFGKGGAVLYGISKFVEKG